MDISYTITQNDETVTYSISSTGSAGPNIVTTDTTTTISGLLKGSSGNVAQAIEDTDYQGVPAEGAFADGDKTKLDGIEAGATADQSAAEIKTAYESNADTNAFTDAEQSKLSGIEALADVTDAANVDAAGAVMESDLVSDGAANPDTALKSDANSSITLKNLNLDGTIPSGAEGDFYYDGTEKTHVAKNDITGSSLNVGHEAWVRVVNNTGSPIANGQAVYINGNDVPSGLPTIALAQADSSATANVLGVTTGSIADTEEGLVTSWGKVRDLNTSAFSNGDLIYLSPSVAGGFTNTKPTRPDRIVEIGYVTKAAAGTAGTITVNLLEDNDALQPGDVDTADITDATSDGDANPEKLLKTSGTGALTVTNLTAAGGGVTLGTPSQAGTLNVQDGGGGGGQIRASNVGLNTFTSEIPAADGNLAHTAQTDGTIRGTDLDYANTADIGAALADADEVLISDGGGNTTRRKSAISRIYTYVKGKLDAGVTWLGNHIFSGNLSVTGDLTVDSGTLSVNSTSNSVGINVPPSQTFHVSGLGNGPNQSVLFAGADTNVRTIFNNTSQPSGSRAYALTLNSGTSGVILQSLTDALGFSSNLVRFNSAGGIDVFSGDLEFLSNSGTWDGATIAGDQSFTGQLEATGQAASTDDSLMTRSLVRDDAMDILGMQFPISLSGAALTSSGTGSNAVLQPFGIAVVSGTDTSGYGSAQLVTGPGGINPFIDYSRPIKSTISVTFSPTAVTDLSSGFRFYVGSAVETALDADMLTNKGFGVEVVQDGSNHKIRAVCHDGTTYTAGSFTNFATGNISIGHYTLTIESDGSGNITAKISSAYGVGTIYTATTTGGPTTLASSANANLMAVATNDSAGTPTSYTARIRAAIYRSE